MKRNFKISSTLSQHNSAQRSSSSSTAQLNASQLSSAQLSELSLFIHGRSKGVQFSLPANRLTLELPLLR